LATLLSVRTHAPNQAQTAISGRPRNNHSRTIVSLRAAESLVRTLALTLSLATVGRFH
jgi:hypothetical protein